MAYAVSDTITIVAAQAGGATHTNFPLVIRETTAGLKTVANGGAVQSALGYDIAFYSDAGLTTQLDHEIEFWDGATGQIVAWVRIPSLSNTVNGTIYLAYGDSGVVTSQQNVPGTWNGNYGAVYHFGANASSYAATVRQDSTANANTLSNGSGFTTQVTGQIGDAIATSNFTQPLIASDAASLKPASALTVECWAKAIGFADYGMMASKGNTPFTSANYALYNIQTTGKARFSPTIGGVFKIVDSTTTLSTTAFMHVVATYDGSNIRIYINGALEGTTAASGSLDTTTDSMWIGEYRSNQFVFNGAVDEVRVSNVARSGAWITAQYNNQKTSQTLYTYASGLIPVSTTQRFTLAML